MQPTLKFTESDQGFSLQVLIENEPFSLDSPFYMVARNRCFSWVVPPKSDRFLYFQLPVEVLHSVAWLCKGASRGAKYSSSAAMRVSALFSGDHSRAAVKTELPDSLAGPEVPLDPKLQLHLIPHNPEGLVAQLRVACDAVADLPIPGVEPRKLQVITPAGGVQFVRDLQAETAIAERYIDALGLAQYPYDGPYNWIADSIPAALQLIERAQKLAAQGLEVCWPKSQPLSYLGEILPQQLRVRVTTQRDWFGFDGELSIEGLQIPFVELLAALRRGGRYVQLASGQFVAISEQLRKRLTQIDDVANVEGNQVRVARVGATLVNEALGDDISVESDAKWQAAIERLTDSTHLPTKPPRGLIADLRDYQQAGYCWLAKLSHWGLGGCLADDMGLGKNGSSPRRTARSCKDRSRLDRCANQRGTQLATRSRTIRTFIDSQTVSRS